jgi:hypothetical protein
MLLECLASDYLRRGKVANVSPDSEYAVECHAFANTVWLAFFNSGVSLGDLSPLTATGDNLKKLCAVFGVPERAAVGSSGVVTVVYNDSTVEIPDSFPASINGEKYVATRVVLSGSANTVRIASVGTGAITNQPTGAILTWDQASIGTLDPTATVVAPGIQGGADTDTEDELRERLLDRLASPSGGGNWAHVRDIAESASAAIERAYVYACARGPSTVDVVVLEKGGARASSKTLGAVAAAINAEFPGFNSLLVQTPNDAPTTLTLRAELSPTVSAGGLGGGWFDAVPWPTAVTTVTAFSNDPITGALLTTDAVDDPKVGNTIGLWNGALSLFAVVAVLGGGQLRIIGRDNPIVPDWIVPGMHVSAGAETMVAIAADVAAAMQTMGPGEKTIDPLRLPRAARKPSPDVVAPMHLTSAITTATQVKHPELIGLEYDLAGTPVRRAPVAIEEGSPPNRLTLGDLSIHA